MGQRMITQPTHAQVSEYTSLHSYFTASKAFDCPSVLIFASIQCLQAGEKPKDALSPHVYSWSTGVRGIG